MAKHAFYPAGTIPQGDTVWVFASELGAIPNRRDGRIAINHFRANPQVPTGPTGQAYGIALRDENHCVLPIADIAWQVTAFLTHARANPQMHFLVTRLGNGAGGLEDRRIARMFAKAPANCVFSDHWRVFLDPSTVATQ